MLLNFITLKIPWRYLPWKQGGNVWVTSFNFPLLTQRAIYTTNRKESWMNETGWSWKSKHLKETKNLRLHSQSIYNVKGRKNYLVSVRRSIKQAIFSLQLIYEFQECFEGMLQDEEECCAPEGINIWSIICMNENLCFGERKVKYLTCPLLSWSQGFKKFIFELFRTRKEE